MLRSLQSALSDRAEILFYSVFTIVLLAGLVTGLAASACRKDSYHGLTKLRYCSISITIGSVLPHDAPKRSIIFVERGIALSELGRAEEAISDFRRALNDVTAARATYLQRIMRRLEDEVPGSMARENFAAAMANRN